MKTMEGARSSATLNSSRTSYGPSPRYFCMSSDPTTRKKVAEVLLATALANNVLPVPGSPYRITPCGDAKGVTSRKSKLLDPLSLLRVSLCACVVCLHLCASLSPSLSLTHTHTPTHTHTLTTYDTTPCGHRAVPLTRSTWSPKHGLPHRF